MANTRRVEILQDHTKLSGDVTGMTMLMTRENLPDEMCDPLSANAAKTDGGDLRFYQNDDSTGRLNLEVVRFEHDSASGASDADVVLWNADPFFVLSSLTDTAIYVEYGDSSLAQPAVDEAFGRNAVWADYAFATHYESATPADAAGNVNFNVFGTLTPVSSALGGGVSATGAGINSSDTASFSVADSYSYSLWANINQITRFSGFFRQENNLNHYRNSNSSGISVAHANTIVNKNNGFGDLVQLNTLARYDFTWSSTDNTVTAYRNAVEIFSLNNSTSPVVQGLYTLGYESSSTFLGYELLDEWHFSNEFKTPAKISTEYANQSNPATFATPGVPVAIGGVDPTGTISVTTNAVASVGGIKLSSGDIQAAIQVSTNITAIKTAKGAIQVSSEAIATLVRASAAIAGEVGAQAISSATLGGIKLTRSSIAPAASIQANLAAKKVVLAGITSSADAASPIYGLKKSFGAIDAAAIGAVLVGGGDVIAGQVSVTGLPEANILGMKRASGSISASTQAITTNAGKKIALSTLEFIGVGQAAINGSKHTTGQIQASAYVSAQVQGITDSVTPHIAVYRFQGQVAVNRLLGVRQIIRLKGVVHDHA